MSPSRGSDRGSPGRTLRPHARASRARSLSSQMSRGTEPSSAGAAASRSIAASASARSPSAARSSSVSTRTPVAATPCSSRCPSRNRWSTAARISGTASSRSPRRAAHAPNRHRASVDRTGCSPWRRYTSLTSASSICPRSHSANVCRCTSARPSVPRAKATARSSPDRSAVRQGILDLAHRRIVGSQHAKRYSREVDVGDNRGVGHRVGAARHGEACVGRRAIHDDPANNGPQPATSRRALTETRKTKSPLRGSPSARSITFCDQRSTSDCPPLSSLGEDKRD